MLISRGTLTSSTLFFFFPFVPFLDGEPFDPLFPLAGGDLVAALSFPLVFGGLLVPTASLAGGSGLGLTSRYGDGESAL